MRKRIGRVPHSSIARLSGYRLAFNKQASNIPGFAYANIVRDDDEVVGVAYDCTAEEIEKLDRYEGVASGDYERVAILVRVGNLIQEAVAYIACSDRVGINLPPTDEYLGRILKGAEDHAFAHEDVIRIERAAASARPRGDL